MAEKSYASVADDGGIVGWDITFSGQTIITYTYTLFEDDHVTPRKGPISGSNNDSDPDSGLMPSPASLLRENLGYFVVTVGGPVDDVDYGFEIKIYQGKEDNVINVPPMKKEGKYLGGALVFEFFVYFKPKP